MNEMVQPIVIYVDADACPVKPEIYRVAERHGVKVFVVSNAFLQVPQNPLIERIVVSSGFDAADDWIAERARRGAIVITADIPLASRCVKAGADVIGPTGKPFTEASVGMALATRNLMEDLRAMGEGNALAHRLRRPTRRAVLVRAAEALARLAPDPEEPGRIRVGFDLVFLTGWAPAASQPKPLRPGSAQMRLAAALSQRKP